MPDLGWDKYPAGEIVLTTDEPAQHSAQSFLAVLQDATGRDYHNLCSNFCQHSETSLCPHAEQLPECGHCRCFRLLLDWEEKYLVYVTPCRVHGMDVAA